MRRHFSWEARKQARYIAIGTDKKSSSPCKERGDLVIGTLIGSSETPKLPNHPNPKDMFFPGEKWTFGWMVRFLQSSGHRGFWVWVRKITPPKQRSGVLSRRLVSDPAMWKSRSWKFLPFGGGFKIIQVSGCTHGFGGTKCQVKVLRWNGFLLPSLLNFKAPGLSETWMNCCIWRFVSEMKL